MTATRPARLVGRAKNLALMGMLVAATTIATTLLKVDIPTYRIYFNAGEAVIYVAALVLGRWHGAVAGAVGASLADVLTGYAFWAPFTFVIKGIEGFVTGTLAARSAASGGLGFGVGIAAGGALMIAGYALSVLVIYGPAAVLPEIGIDVAQVAVGAVVAVPTSLALRRAFRFDTIAKEDID